ncbi:MAG: hypothetical protein K9N23_06865 [Akkermansiaceae bacterium]|nr:hypothetical protein [Akkermansiaceae bacterium]
MKPTLLIALVAALAGFLGGWLAKPAPAPAPAPVTTTADPQPPPLSVPRPGAQPPPPRPAPTPLDRLRPGPGSEVPALAAGAVDAAKLQRLVEVLKLDEEARAELEKIVAESRDSLAATDPTKPLSAKDTLAQAAATGARLEQALKAFFSPEQAAAFAGLRQRERDNRIEAKAQRELGRLSQITDLSPAQRELILVKLRATNAAELDLLPGGIALMIAPSVLPLGPLAMQEQALLTLARIAEADTPDTHPAPQVRLLDHQSQQLDEQLGYLQSILTPAQLAQYQVAAAAQRSIRQRLRPR